MGSRTRPTLCAKIFEDGRGSGVGPQSKEPVRISGTKGQGQKHELRGGALPTWRVLSVLRLRLNGWDVL